MITERILTYEAEYDRADFTCNVESYGCTCFISPPCSYCTHPGNPRNQEDDSCWTTIEREETPAEILFGTW